MAHHRLHRRRRKGMLLLAGFLLTAGLSAGARTASLEPAMTNNPLLADPRPWCIGRLVMDRPAHSEMFYEGYEYWGAKIDIASNVSPGTFQYKVETREKELRTKKRTVLLPLTTEMMRNRDNGIKEIDTPGWSRPFPRHRILDS